MDENIEALITRVQHKDLEEIINQVKRDVKEARVTLGDSADYTIRWLPFGIPPLDNILGGGLPFGRTVLLKGQFSSGKTFLAQMAIKSAQKLGFTCAYIDVEKALDPEWWVATGVDLTNVIVSRPGSGEEALDVAVALVKAETNLIVLDSVAALIPTSEAEGTMDDHGIGARARLLNQGLRKITRENRGKSIFLLTNYPMMGIGAAPFPTEALPAGRGQWQWASIVLDIRRKQWLKDGDKRIGFQMQLHTEKNKVHIPLLTCEVPFIFEGGGIDIMRGLADIAIDVGVITQKGPYYYCDLFPDGKIRGKKAVVDFLKANESVSKTIQDRLHGSPNTRTEETSQESES